MIIRVDAKVVLRFLSSSFRRGGSVVVVVEFDGACTGFVFTTVLVLGSVPCSKNLF